jgi:hypothetical protein
MFPEIHGRFKPFLKNISLLISSIAATAIVLEVILRIIGVHSVDLRPPIHRPSAVPGLEYELKPLIHERGFYNEYVTTDSRGFRSAEINPGQPVIAFLGDSFTFGFGVKDNETNPAAVQARFPDYAVVNTGVNGYNIEQETLAYENKVARLDPRLVVLEFVFNDADRKAYYERDIRPALPWLVSKSGSQVSFLNPLTWHFPGSRFLKRTSFLIGLIERGLNGMSAKKPQEIPLFGNEWSDEWIGYYAKWFDRLTRDIGDRPKLLVIWPDHWLYPQTLPKIYRLAEDRSWKILDVGQVIGIRYSNLGWDPHPSAKTQKQVGNVIANYLMTFPFEHWNNGL